MFKLINKIRKVKAFYYCFYAVWVTCVIGFVEKVLGYEHPLGRTRRCSLCEEYIAFCECDDLSWAKKEYGDKLKL